jgi:hypothetical protein
MKPARIAAWLILAAPAVAAAQITYSQPRILAAPEAPIYYTDRDCDAARIHLSNRGGALERERLDYASEAASIAREGAALSRELARLDASSPAAVASYNARSADHNRRVDDHNARVAGMNAEAAAMNSELAQADSQCALPPLIPIERIR